MRILLANLPAQEIVTPKKKMRPTSDEFFLEFLAGLALALRAPCSAEQRVR